MVTNTSRAFRDVELPIDDRIADLLARLSVEEKIALMMDESPGVPRLGVAPYKWWNECLHGVARAGRATVFPQAIGLAATFNAKLLRQIGQVISTEARAKHHAALRENRHQRYTGLTFWSPNINIFRDPRWGRGQETFGEDPHLTAVMGSAFVQGLQGDDPRYLRVAACAKHYAVHSGPEETRHGSDVQVSPRDLEETYLYAFRRLVENGVESVMGAYNRVNGEPCCGSVDLLQNHLRDQWGFTGHVVSDCGAIDDFHLQHHVTHSPEESAAKALLAGCDLNCGSTYQTLRRALTQKLIAETDIDRSLARLLRTQMKLGMFDAAHHVPYSRISTDVLGCPRHRRLARQAAQQSIVLLKNDAQILPLNPAAAMYTIAGPAASDGEVLLGNYSGLSGNQVSILAGITARVSPTTTLYYAASCQYDRGPEEPPSQLRMETVNAEAVIAVMGISPLFEGEEGDAIASTNAGDRLNLGLPDAQIRMLKSLKKLGKPLVLIVTGGSPIISREMYAVADAVLWVWYPGQEGGHAVADVLFGDVSPSGRLPITFPQSIEDLPDYGSYSMQDRTYRYSSHAPLYPFGFGLSYTRFRYSGLKLSRKKIKKGQDVIAQVTVTNCGKRKGAEVVQLYLRRTGAGPLMALRDFKRVTLAPNASALVTFKILPSMMSIIDSQGHEVCPAGLVEVILAGACPVQRSIALGAPCPAQASFKITE